MKYSVKLFASLREQAQTAEWECESPTLLTGSQLLQHFFGSFPHLEKLRTVTRLAVNQGFCKTEVTLNPDDEIALIPPVSGG